MCIIRTLLGNHQVKAVVYVAAWCGEQQCVQMVVVVVVVMIEWVSERVSVCGLALPLCHQPLVWVVTQCLLTNSCWRFENTTWLHLQGQVQEFFANVLNSGYWKTVWRSFKKSKGQANIETLYIVFFVILQILLRYHYVLSYILRVSGPTLLLAAVPIDSICHNFITSCRTNWQFLNLFLATLLTDSFSHLHWLLPYLLTVSNFISCYFTYWQFLTPSLIAAVLTDSF